MNICMKLSVAGEWLRTVHPTEVLQRATANRAFIFFCAAAVLHPELHRLFYKRTNSPGQRYQQSAAARLHCQVKSFGTFRLTNTLSRDGLP